MLELDEGFDRARLMWDFSSDGLSLHAPYDWRYIDVNKTGLDMMGLAANEVIGRPALDFFHPEDAEAFRANRAEILYKEGVYTKQHRIRHKDGHYFWVESTHRSVRDKSTGKLVEIACVSRDITARRESEEQMRRLAEVVQSSSDMVIFFDPQLCITYANGAARSFAGAASSLKDLLSAQELVRFEQLVMADARAAGRWSGSLRFRFGEGRSRIGEIRQVARTGEEAAGFLAMATDITESLRAETEAKRHRSKVNELARTLAVSEVSTVLAHEVNQPLGAIMNYASGALRRLETGAVRDAGELEGALRKIALQADRAGAIIRSLRAIARRKPRVDDRIAINGICQNIVALVIDDAAQADVTISLNLVEDAGAIQGDSVLIEQAVMNLVVNAIAAATGSERRDVTIETRREGTDIVLSVRDSGSGISAEHAGDIFDPYVTTRSSGLGLGLPIARSIVGAHRGAIWFDPPGGEGAAFHIRFPRAGEEKQ